MMPVMMETIADELGLEAAEKLADVLGGHEITIPAVRSEGSSLSEIVGEPIAAVLIENYGGGRVTIPSWKSRKSDQRRQLILDNENLSVNELVTMTGLSSRQVRRIRTEKKRRYVTTTMDRVQRK